MKTALPARYAGDRAGISRLDTVAGLQHRVAESREKLCRQRAQRLLDVHMTHLSIRAVAHRRRAGSADASIDVGALPSLRGIRRRRCARERRRARR